MRIYLTIFYLFLCSFFAKAQNLANDSITINMHMKPQSSMLLDYHDDYLVYRNLFFRNRSPRDTFIVKKIKSDHILEFTYGIFHEGLKENFFYFFYAKKGDTIDLELQAWKLKNIGKNKLLFVSDFLDIDDSPFKPRPKQTTMRDALSANKIVWEANLKKIDSLRLGKQINDSIADLWREAANGAYHTSRSRMGYGPQELYLDTLVTEFKQLLLKPTPVNSAALSSALHRVGNYQKTKGMVNFNLKTFIEELIKVNTEKRYKIGTAFMALERFPEKSSKLYLESYVLFIKELADPVFLAQDDAQKINPTLQAVDRTTIKLLTAKNEPLTLEDIFKKNKGKIMVFDFWASWCVPCIEEFPAYQKVMAKLANKNIVFIGIGLDKDKKENDWKASLTKFKINSQNQFRVIERSAV
jgi:thiol-disulfide isomerase/thioredoxin